MSIRDMMNRPLRDLRISVTDRCNFRCQYCMPAEIFGPDYAFLPEDKVMSFEEIERLVRVFVSLGTEKIRITGGEPLLRKGLPKLIQSLRQVEGVNDIALTTNGVYLKRLVGPLREAGLDRINVSLDSLKDDQFGLMNGRGYPVAPILEAIDAAGEAGLPVKINTVVQRGVNDDEIVDIAERFRGTGHIVRFIEFMDVGNSNGWELERVVPSGELVARIHEEFPLEPVDANYFGEVASRYRYVDGQGEIGVISSVTHAFCSSCTRARLSAEGRFYTCLFASSGTDLLTPLRAGASDDELSSIVAQVWGIREDRYSEIRLSHTPSLPKVEMSHIGG
jgi:GTP 3',8-cyclase